jgi:hypothetical protein
MSLPARLFRCLSLSLAMLAPAAALAEPSAIYLVRHGEKATVGQDPELTPQGQARAQAIATILSRTGITSVFSTPTQRTRQTAQPLAQRAGLEVQLYDPRAPKALVEKVKALSGPVLVVGPRIPCPSWCACSAARPAPTSRTTNTTACTS